MNIIDTMDTINGLKKAADALEVFDGIKLAEYCRKAVLLIEGQKPIPKERVDSLFGDKYVQSYRCPECAKPIDEGDCYCRYCGLAVLPVQII